MKHRRAPASDWLREVFEDGFWSGLRYLLYYSWAYPRIQRLAHRFNLHHMKVSHMPDGELLWCHWCGAKHFEPNLVDAFSIAAAHAQQHITASQTIQPGGWR